MTFSVYDPTMCGRFALGIPKVRLEEIFEISLPDNYVPRYNVAPGTDVLTVVAPEGMPRPAFLRWGLIPHWAGDAAAGNPMINARSETVFDKPAFEQAILSARCLVPAQAFYEWKKEDGRKQPYAIKPDGSDVFAMAGIKSYWEDRTTGESLESFALLTCPASGVMAAIHDRMPVILSPEDWEQWLDPTLVDQKRLKQLLENSSPDKSLCWPVGTGVNSVQRDCPDLLDRVDVMRQGRLIG